jgi:hypothetical protein
MVRTCACRPAGWGRRDPEVAGGLGPVEVRGAVEDTDPAARGERQTADGDGVGEESARTMA